MDNVFQIVIYLLIIISFIAPIFRKKNQGKNAQQPQRQRFPLQNGSIQNSEMKIAGSQPKQQDFDALKELENFFKVDSEEKIETAYNQNLKYEGFQQEPKPALIPETKDYQSTWEKKKAEVESVVKSLDKKIEIQAEQFHNEMAYQEKSISNQVVLRLKKNIRNPSSLKEYILFSEIIGKPKALRR
jgi:hypothetical protein